MINCVVLSMCRVSEVEIDSICQHLRLHNCFDFYATDSLVKSLYLCSLVDFNIILCITRRIPESSVENAS